jgi:hypothetical protein
MLEATRVQQDDALPKNHRSGAVTEKENIMGKSMNELIAEFQASGGKVKKLDTGATSGMRKRDWDNLVRGTKPPVVEEIQRNRTPGTLHIRAGFGLAR